MKTFNWTYFDGEYSIYLDDEIFCHLSETDFGIFNSMVNKSGNKLLRRV